MIFGIPNPENSTASNGTCTWGSTAATPGIALRSSATASSIGTTPTPIPSVEASLTMIFPT
jgi:hypothetical protein